MEIGWESAVCAARQLRARPRAHTARALGIRHRGTGKYRGVGSLRCLGVVGGWRGAEDVRAEVVDGDGAFADLLNFAATLWRNTEPARLPLSILAFRHAEPSR
jgi:hypothetical protein